MLARVRFALATLLLFTLAEFVADALEVLTDDREFLGALDPYQVAHLDEAAACSARVWDLLRYVRGEGSRVEGVEA